MKRFLELIDNSKLCYKEKPLQSIDVIITQKDLVKMGCPFLPTGFIDFLKQYNGLTSSDSVIFGIPPLENESLNIVDFNARYNTLPNMAILGYDDSAFLVYDNAENKYKLIDRYDDVMLDEYLEDELVYALNSILHI